MFHMYSLQFLYLDSSRKTKAIAKANAQVERAKQYTSVGHQISHIHTPVHLQATETIEGLKAYPLFEAMFFFLKEIAGKGTKVKF